MSKDFEFSPYRPFLTLLKKELVRFMSIASQTLVAPLVTASLYLVIFGVNLGHKISILPGISYLDFVIPGLILMGVANNSFANTSSSLFMSRYLGSIVDFLVTPITGPQFIMAYTLAAMIRGLLVGVVIALVSTFFSPLHISLSIHAVLTLLMASFLFSQLGLLAAIYAKNFDTLSMFTNFLILPLIYLGGLFYPVSSMPQPWRQLSELNPLYYLIEGLRHAFLGHSDVSFALSFTVGGSLCLITFVWASFLISTGYKIRN